MQSLPHLYNVKATGTVDNQLQVNIANLAELNVAPPVQFGGPGDQWSPEDLFMASFASCFILSFRAIARASKLNWLSIECDAQGELDKVDGKTQFTKIDLTAKLVIAAEESAQKAETLLNKAEKTCLVSNSLRSEVHLKCEVMAG